MTAVSVNLVNGDSYELPADGDDRAGIDNFLSHNSGKPVVVVQGLGFVGGVMSLVCANATGCEYAVIGTDLRTAESYWKIRAFNDGILPLKSSDTKVEKYFRRAHEKGNFYATFDESAYGDAEIIIVDVNLDVQKDSGSDWSLESFDVDLSPFRRAIAAIGRNCRPDVLILVETTVPPGTCSKIVKPIIEQELATRGLPIDEFRLGHSYERVMPGPDYVDSIQNFYRVYSGVDDASADATEAFLRTIIRTDEYPLTRLHSTNATEMAKVLENSYRAMNIAFIVEWTRFAEETGVNLYEVVNAIRMRDTHANIMFPGIGVGGYCLTKDPLLASWARRSLFESPDGLGQSEQGVRINDQMPLFAFDYLEKNVPALEGKRVLLLGVSYRGDVGDTRYSPVEPFYHLLRRAGAHVSAHDYFVDYWSECSVRVETDLETALDDDYNVIVLSAMHSAYRRNKTLLSAIAAKPGCIVYDTLGLLSEEELEQIGPSSRLLVLGRGRETLPSQADGQI